MPWRRIALWTVCSAAFLVAAAGVWLFTADLGFLKPYIEARVSTASGRRFSIDGTLDMRLGRRATAIANGVRWQNAAWADSAEMMRIARIEIDVDLLSALRGPFVVERIVVRDATIQVTRNARDESNWTLFEDSEASSDPQVDGPRTWMVRHLDVRDVSVRVTGPERSVPLDLRIHSLRQDVSPDDVVATSLDASANGRGLSVVSRVETWTSLLRRGSVDYELEARLDRLTLESQGKIDSLAAPRRPKLVFSLEGPALSDLSVLAGLGQQGIGDVSLDGSLAAADDGPLVLDVAGNLGETVIDAAGTFSDLQSLGHAELQASARGPNLARLLALLGIDHVEEMAFTLNVDIVRNGSLLDIRESTLEVGDAKAVLKGQAPEFPTLANARASVRLAGPAIERLRHLAPIPDALTGPFSIELDLDATDARREALRVDADTSLGRLSANGSLGPPPKHFGSRAQVRFEGKSLAAIAAAWKLPGPAAVPFDVTGDLELRADGIHLRNGELSWGNHEARIAGLIGIARGWLGSDLRLTLSGPNLADLGRTVYPIDGLPVTPYELAANIAIDDAGYHIREVTSKIGDSQLEAHGLITRRRDLGGSRARLAIRGPSLETLVPAVGDRRIRPGSFNFEADAAIGDGRIRLDRVLLEREFADLEAKLALPWPLSFESAEFEIHGRGRDIRAFVGEPGGVRLDALPYSVAVDGSRRGSAWALSRLDLKLGDAEAHLSGSLDYGDTLEASRLSIDSTIPSLAALGTIDGRRLRDGPVALHATVISDDGGLSATDLRIGIDEGSVGGTISWRPGDVPVLDVALRSDYLALHSVTPAQPEGKVTPGERDRTRLIPDLDLPLNHLQRIDGSLRLDIREFRRNELDLRDLTLFAELRAGALELHDLTFRGKSGDFRASALLDQSRGQGHVRIDATADRLRLDLNTDGALDGMTADAIVRLESHGTNLRDLAGSADGVLLLDVRNGRLPNSRLLQAIYGSLLDEIVSTINPFSKTSEYTQLACVVVPVRVVAGQMTSAPRMLILTDKIRMLSKNTIDLKTEGIDLHVRTTPLKSISISAAEMVNPYVKIGGTLAAPKLAIDQKGAMVAGGAAVATGGLSVLARATWDRLPQSEDPCGDAVAEGRKALEQQPGAH